MTDEFGCWPPNLPPETRVQAEVVVPIAAGISSYSITVEDSAGAFTRELVNDGGDRSYDEFDLSTFNGLQIPVGGTWSGSGEDFTIVDTRK